MPLVRLIFFPDPRELTEAQVEEARANGHLVEVVPEPAAAALPPPKPPAPAPQPPRPPAA